MTIDRRQFMTSMGGAAAAAHALASSACNEATVTSAGSAQPVAVPGFDARTLPGRINADAEFQLKARYWDALVRLKIDDRPYDVRLRAGKVVEIVPSSESVKADIVITGPAQAWARGVMAHGLQIQGDQVGHVAPYRGAILRIIANIGEGSGQPVPEVNTTEVDRPFDSAIGRYMYVRVRGVQYRVYFEEAGKGIPMLVQHLAGSDGRVWQHLLEDADIQKQFRIIVYDMPYHGRSLPPSTVRWWTEPYRPTEGFLIDTILAISHALKLERPVYLGNGIGGYLAPALAYYHPEEFRSVIAVNSGIASRVPLARSQGEALPVSSEPNMGNHPRVGNERHGTTVYELTSPEAPEASRQELAQPLADAIGEVWLPTQRNDANIVNQFDLNRDVIGCLENLVVVPVGTRKASTTTMAAPTETNDRPCMWSPVGAPPPRVERSELIFHAGQLDADPVRILQVHALVFRERVPSGSGLALRKSFLKRLDSTIDAGPGIEPDGKVIDPDGLAPGD